VRDARHYSALFAGERSQTAEAPHLASLLRTPSLKVPTRPMRIPSVYYHPLRLIAVLALSLALLVSQTPHSYADSPDSPHETFWVVAELQGMYEGDANYYVAENPAWDEVYWAVQIIGATPEGWRWMRAAELFEGSPGYWSDLFIEAQLCWLGIPEQPYLVGVPSVCADGSYRPDLADILHAWETVTIALVGPRPEQEPWRELVAIYFQPKDVNKALRVIDCESNGEPDAVNPSSGAAGLFQQMPQYWAARARAAGMPGASIFNPVANVAASAWLVYHGGGWGHWNGAANCGGK